MAEPTEFIEQNHIYQKPRDMSDDDCSSLPCHVHEQGVISKWELTEGEVEEIKSTGCVYLNVMAIPPPPVWVSGLSPFAEVKLDISEPAPDYTEYIDLVRHAAKYAFFLSATEQERLDIDEARELAKLLKEAIDAGKSEAIKEMMEDA